MRFLIRGVLGLLLVGGTALAQDPIPRGGQFQINSYTTSWQTGAKVSGDAGDNFVVVWMSDGSNGSDRLGYSIQGQRFTIAIFTDGFESGDTSAWSSTVQ